MARFEIPAGWAAQAYQFALDPTPTQAAAMVSHAAGARFAYNLMLAAVAANLHQRAAERSYGARHEVARGRASQIDSLAATG